NILAIRRPDGTIDGRLSLRIDLETPVFIEAEPTCVTLVGNTARLAAVVTQSNTLDNPVGSYLIWTVVDNQPQGEPQKGGRKPELSSVFIKMLTEFYANWICMVGINISVIP